MGNIGLCISSAPSSQRAKQVESCAHYGWSSHIRSEVRYRQRRSQLKLVNTNVAKLLLVDGSFLQFRKRVKVMRVLMEYPDHFVCALDSLRPGQHSLSSLLPHEELQLGHLYLLLPLRDTRSRHHSSCSMHSSVKDSHHLHHELQHPRRILWQSPRNTIVQASNSIPKTKLINKKKKGTDYQHQMELQELLSDGDNESEPSIAGLDDNGMYQRHGRHLPGSLSCTGRSKIQERAGLYSPRIAAAADIMHSGTNQHHQYEGSALINHNTQELLVLRRNLRQADGLRRSRTWTPRLRPITESTTSTSASSSSTTRQIGAPS